MFHLKSKEKTGVYIFIHVICCKTHLYMCIKGMLLLRSNFLLNNILNPGFCLMLIDKELFASLKTKACYVRRALYSNLTFWLGENSRIINLIWNQGNNIWLRGNNFILSFKDSGCLCLHKVTVKTSSNVLSGVSFLFLHLLSYPMHVLLF